MKRRTILSLGIILTALGLAYLPAPGGKSKIIIVSGTELQEPLKELETIFEKNNKNIDIELKFQGSQDTIDDFIDQKNDFKPTILIPANGEKLKELRDRYAAQTEEDPFYFQPQVISKTMVVAVAWPDRGKVLFPDDRFDWQKIEQAMRKQDWGAIGGDPNWGSFDFLMTNPTRSNSGQLTMTLWSNEELGVTNLNSSNINNPQITTLFSLVKRSVYQPPRSTDTLLENFITLGPNNADVATVYESIALYRWSQAKISQDRSYQIYYLNPTIETKATAAIVRRDVDGNTARSAKKFVDFLRQPQQQKIFVKYGFRSVIPGINLKSVPQSPWSEDIPGAKINPPQTIEPPQTEVLGEIQRLWQRAN
ncbi:MAG: substrate-binding domain-containing protein [Prochloraceae cyanobacterium]|nr:substrate-binding domain-containing protein [Prochloraceae cyanobacterium]